MSDHEVDVVVVGLGPGGETAATQLAGAGLDVVGVDRHLVGGECPYYGCIPSKMMIRAADALAEARRVPGLAGAASVTPDWAPVAEPDPRRGDRRTGTTRSPSTGSRRPGSRSCAGVRRLAGPRTVDVDGDDVLRPRVGVVLNTGTAPAVPPDRRARRHAVLDQPRRGEGRGPAGLAGRHRRRRDRGRAGPGVLPVRGAGHPARGRRPDPGARRSPRRAKLVADVFGAEGIQVLTGVEIASVSYADGPVRGRGRRPDPVRRQAAGRRGPAARTSATRARRRSGSTPSARSLDTDDADARGRGAVGHRRHHRQGRLHAHVDVPGGGRGRRHPRPGRSRGGVPRRAAGDLHRSRGRLGRDDRAAGTGRRAGRARSAARTCPRRRAAGSPGPRGWSSWSRTATAASLVGATAVGPSGGEILSMLTTAVHARSPGLHAALDDLRLPDLPPGGRGRPERPRRPGLTRTGHTGGDSCLRARAGSVTRRSTSFNEPSREAEKEVRHADACPHTHQWPVRLHGDGRP